MIKRPLRNTNTKMQCGVCTNISTFLKTLFSILEISLFIIFLGNMTSGCNSKEKTLINENNIYNNRIPKVKPINLKTLRFTEVHPDSIPKITPGKNGIPLPKIVKAGQPDTTKNELTPIPAGKPKIVKLDSSKIIKIKIGEGNVPLPKKYIIPDSGFLLQHNDTIYAPQKIIAKQTEPKRAVIPHRVDGASYNIQYLDVDQGMPSSYVWSIIEDKNGYIWFGTYGGEVGRYDGTYFTTITQLKGISSNIVYSIIEDKSGNIWFGTGNGVCKYDGEFFTIYKTEQGLTDNLVYSIQEDKNGNLWFGTNKGISLFDWKSFTNYTKNEGLIEDAVLSLTNDKDGNIWFGTNNGAGKLVINQRNGKDYFISYSDENELKNKTIKSILADKNGNIWFGTQGSGAICLDGNYFYTYTKSEGLSNNVVRSIIEDKKGNIWLGTRENGVSKLLLNPNKALEAISFTIFSENEGLSSNRIYRMKEDSWGNLWICTSGGGLCKLAQIETNDYHGISFTTYNKVQGPASNYILSILEDKKGNLWLGTLESGVSCFNGNTFVTYNKTDGLIDNRVYAIEEDKAGNLWFGTLKGISKFNGESFTNYTQNEGLPENSIRSIYEDSNGNIWIGTRKSGVCCYDGESFSIYNKQMGLAGNRVISIVEDKNKNMWFGTFDGGGCQLQRKIKDGKNENTFITYSETEGLANNKVLSVIEDSRGDILFGTYGGGLSKLVIENEIGKHFINYSEAEGLASNKIRLIIEDKQNKLWIGTDKGLNCMISPNNNLKTEQQILTFDKNDGLKTVDFFRNSVCIDKRNRIWFGNSKALTKLDLNHYKIPTDIPMVRLNTIKINQRFIEFRTFSDTLISESSNGWKKYKEVRFADVPDFQNYPINLELPHKLNHLTFYFSAIDLVSPHKIRYRYKIEGIDNNWSQLTKEPYADYRNIPFGKFKFKAQAIGVSNVWSNILEYEFTIHPPWWRTWWAYITYLIIGAVLILIIVKLNARRLVQQKQQLQQVIDNRTADVRRQKDELEIAYKKLKALGQFKENMIGMIVHDLKNPLNAIINASENESAIKFKKLKHYGKQMLNMVLNILDVQKFEDTKMVLDVQDYFLYELVHKAILEIKFLALQKNISVSNDIEYSLNVKVDKDIVERIFVNILSNAIKYTPNNGTITLLAKKKPNITRPKVNINSKVYVEIIDTGQGIPKNELNKVFDKFRQIGTDKISKTQSTGLGLTFCKMAVEAHDCQIGIESEVGIGTICWFTLPVGKKIRLSQEKVKTTIQRTKLELSENDKTLIKPFVSELKSILVFESTKINNVLKKIPSENSYTLRKWKDEMQQVIYTMNEEKYDELIDIN